MINHLKVPDVFNRNAPDVVAQGPENTGQQLIELVMEKSNLPTLEHLDILDVGCGVRFTQTLVNRAIPFGSYTGVEVHKPIVDFLKESVEAEDERFHYYHFDIKNALYNPMGIVDLGLLQRFPKLKTFDVIWLFSVFTHLNLGDAGAMLRILRTHIRPTGTLFFSAFIDASLDGFVDRQPQAPLLNAYFGLNTMTGLLAMTGWKVDGFYWHDEVLPIMDYFVCSPVDQDL